MQTAPARLHSRKVWIFWWAEVRQHWNLLIAFPSYFEVSIHLFLPSVYFIFMLLSRFKQRWTCVAGLYSNTDTPHIRVYYIPSSRMWEQIHNTGCSITWSLNVSLVKVGGAFHLADPNMFIMVIVTHRSDAELLPCSQEDKACPPTLNDSVEASWSVEDEGVSVPGFAVHLSEPYR